MSELTPFQTIGPFFRIGMGDCATLSETSAGGRCISVEGTVIDGAGQPMTDALVEIWQTNTAGKYRHSNDDRELPVDASFDGFGRCLTDDAGRFAFTTVMPGCVPGPDGTLQAPHLLVSVFARGVLTRLATRIYFEGESANSEDLVLAIVPAERRSTLIARRDGPDRYRFDIVVQGRNETVFFDV